VRLTVTVPEYDVRRGKTHRNGGFMSMEATKTTGHRSVKKPIAGRWAWRDYGPSCRCELEDLRERAMAANPDGIDVLRFMGWVEVEFAGRPLTGVVPRGAAALAKYRRFLYELNVDHEPVDRDPGHAPDVDVDELPCAFGGVVASAENPRFLAAGSVNLAAA
jgi:hypothetical protein